MCKNSLDKSREFDFWIKVAKSGYLNRSQINLSNGLRIYFWNFVLSKSCLHYNFFGEKRTSENHTNRLGSKLLSSKNASVHTKKTRRFWLVFISKQSKMSTTRNVITSHVLKKSHFFQDLESYLWKEYFRIPHCDISQIILQYIGDSRFSSIIYAFTFMATLLNLHVLIYGRW